MTTPLPPLTLMAELSASVSVSVDAIEPSLSSLNEKQQLSDHFGPWEERDQLYNKQNGAFLHGVAAADSAVSEIGFSELQEPVSLVEDAGMVDPLLILNEKFSDDDMKENSGVLQETKEKKVKKPRRRGGKHRKNKDSTNCIITLEKKEEGIVYRRKEMEALRFEDLDGQKKKWVEVYCRLCPSVALEYDDLVNSDSNPEPSICFDFDPRPQFRKASASPASVGEDCCHPPNNNKEPLYPLDPTYFIPFKNEISCSGAEEESSPDYSSDEDYSSIQKPAFLVTGEPDFDSGPPQDGLEYLRRVRWEASQIPDVTIAKIESSKLDKGQTLYMPQIPQIMECPENLLPLKEWEDYFLAYFSELRLGFSQLDLQGSNVEDSVDFQSVIMGYFESLLCGYDLAPSEPSSSHTPENLGATCCSLALSSIFEMDSASRTSMLKKRISAFENMSTLSRNDCLWLFSLSVAVDSPLEADTSASLRSLLRKCASLRAVKTNADDEVAMLNILITISGRYFGQLGKG